ncbi:MULTISPECIES: GNAT family N-acetyltransferase [unclassified Exiguobacterium]|uniref:GNAT family N-acetyltransferase n=1 Tax=Exiguobacterium TaxID=33986 RepID=UPI0020365CFE|nr:MULTISPECIES: GNAT family N-acetyltransferase [unclassified Exiguobacterium]
MMEVQIITAEEVIPLRHDVLRPHQPREACIYPDDALASTFHLGGIKAQQIVAIGSFSEQSHAQAPGATYQLRGMASSEEVRGEGYGRALIEEARRLLKERQVTAWWCNARVTALPFYERLGLERVGEPFLIEGIGLHYVMIDRLDDK